MTRWSVFVGAVLAGLYLCLPDKAVVFDGVMFSFTIGGTLPLCAVTGNHGDAAPQGAGGVATGRVRSNSRRNSRPGRSNA